MELRPQFKIRLPDGREFGPGSIEMLVQWAREGRVPMDALLVSADGVTVQSVLAEPMLRLALQAPPTVSTGVVVMSSTGGDAPMSGMIPYKNPPALIGYYFAIASLIPFMGALLGMIALILGIIGLRKRLRDPSVRGIAHAWIAILLGGLMMLIWGGLIVAGIVGAMNS